jgi:uncharacterized protein (DUF1684 family)
MKPSTIFLTIFILAALALVIYSFNAGLSPEEYKAQLAKEREEKDLFMRNSEESPFAKHEEKFKGLAYFEADLNYKVNAKLVEIPSKKMMLLGTSSGEEERYLEYAFAEFELNGKQNRLLILELVAPGATKGTLFLAFADNTSANETYGAGRYLDIKKVPGSTSVVLDFNKAYNPYCAYNDNFSCPFPPKENFLNIAIYAGEKVYHE